VIKLTRPSWNQNILLAITTVIASCSIATAAKADTVDAHCDVYPKGSDRVTSSGRCTFSQRQGGVGIQLQNGIRYDLSPVGDQPGNYLDQNGRAAYRQSGLGDKGQIYRLDAESIFVYWDTSAYKNQSSQLPPSRPVTKRFANLTASQDSRINVRSGPSVNFSAPNYGVTGDRVEVMSCVQDQDTDSGLNWCNITFVQSKATGWVRSDFIVFSDGGE